jgi:hypothetical protein
MYGGILLTCSQSFISIKEGVGGYDQMTKKRYSSNESMAFKEYGSILVKQLEV